MFEVEPLSLPDACLIRHPVFADERGRFSVTAHRDGLASLGLEHEWIQENESFSSHVHTLRGLHAQHAPFAQAKLVRCVAGRILDIIVDARHGSPTFGQSASVELSQDAPVQLLVPAGFLHGFITLEPDCVVNYKVDAPYSPEHDFSVAWNDADLALGWPAKAVQPVLSDKDRAAGSWQEFLRHNTFTYTPPEAVK
ncbi:MAG: dTDP-4-dehydrorhamnose 3,5-epimerase [Maricaulis sp.]|nr:dTDP-4-dehydrorhamnose 3,5-epimerase [Maricaulis sp.]